DSETEWIKLAIQEPALTLDEHRDCHNLVRLYSGNRLVKHGPSLLGRTPLLSEGSAREREGRSRYRADRECAKHWSSPCDFPTIEGIRPRPRASRRPRTNSNVEPDKSRRWGPAQP